MAEDDDPEPSPAAAAEPAEDASVGLGTFFGQLFGRGKEAAAEKKAADVSSDYSSDQLAARRLAAALLAGDSSLDAILQTTPAKSAALASPRYASPRLTDGASESAAATARADASTGPASEMARAVASGVERAFAAEWRFQHDFGYRN